MRGGSKGRDVSRHLAAMTDIKQIMVPENASKLKKFVNAFSDTMAANPQMVTPSMSKAMETVQGTIRAGESDQDFARRFAAMHIKNAVKVPKADMEEGLRLLQVEAWKKDKEQPKKNHEEAVPAQEEPLPGWRLEDITLQDAIRTIMSILQRLDGQSSGGAGGIGAQQTQDEWWLFLFTIGVVLFAIFPQILPAQFEPGQAPPMMDGGGMNGM